jgi:DNA-binding XRE family transcriptional regulator
MTRQNLPISERIEKHIVSKDCCWITDLFCRNGYPMIVINKKRKSVHRVMFELHNGEIPDKILVCHTCDNPACINPDHLFLGTNQDNVNDKLAKNRQAKGSKLPQAKLNEEKVLEIKRDLAKKNLTQKEIAKKYGISERTISSIKTGTLWSHVKYEPTNNYK